MIEQSGQSMERDGVDGISYKDCKLQTKTCKTVREFVFKYYPWYYEYEKLFYNYPGVNPTTLIRSWQLISYNSQIVNDIELERYNKDFQKRELSLPDSKGLSDQNKEEDVV